MPPNHWPSPPFFEHLFLESPWALVITFGLVGVALFVVGGQREQRRVQYLAFVLFTLCVAAPILAYSIETDREAILNRTRQLIDAAKSPQDSEAMTDMISDFATYDRFNADNLRSLIQRAAQVVQIDQYSITNTLARLDSPRFGSTYAAGVGRVSFRNNGGPFKTRFILKWRKDDDLQWRITEIVELDINEKSALRYIRMIGWRR